MALMMASKISNFVNAADGQSDCITTDTNGEDYSWDAIWKSKAIITNFGWVVEMRIPYAARFSGEKKQTWGLNFSGNKTIPTKYTWNFIDSKLELSHNKPEFLKE
jgi:hypothetical protein